MAEGSRLEFDAAGDGSRPRGDGEEDLGKRKINYQLQNFDNVGFNPDSWEIWGRQLG